MAPAQNQPHDTEAWPPEVDNESEDYLIAGLLCRRPSRCCPSLALAREGYRARPAKHPRPIAKLAADSFDTLDVTKNKVTTTLKKDGNAYKIVKPVRL